MMTDNTPTRQQVQNAVDLYTNKAFVVLECSPELQVLVEAARVALPHLPDECKAKWRNLPDGDSHPKVCECGGTGQQPAKRYAEGTYLQRVIPGEIPDYEPFEIDEAMIEQAAKALDPYMVHPLETREATERVLRAALEEET